ncbi:MAG: hypothetical protein JNK45_22570 [Myxococcales bacterium]|nr:hypothetical protein [Myxococcales bacterium]
MSLDDVLETLAADEDGMALVVEAGKIKGGLNPIDWKRECHTAVPC